MTRVLIVDDKEPNIYYLRALLTGHGYSVDDAHHGAEALFKARQSPPDVIVSDLLMPVMDGYTLLRHWKTDARLQQVPFIVYTATYTEAEDERLALNLGADAFILKPSEPEDFLARLREVQAHTVARPNGPKHPTGDEQELLKIYSETLIRKLEEKTIQLQEANAALQRDIEERRLAEERLRESEERFRATFEQAAVGLAHVAPDGRFLRVNDKLCAITGYTREELLRETFMALTAAEDRVGSDEARRSMLAGTTNSYSAEKRYRRKDGRLIWASIVTTLLRDAAQQPKYFISVVTDITERKALQEQLLRAQRMESIGTLAGGIAHDLNNLLSPILMGVGLLKMETHDPETLKLIDTMEESAHRGTNLVKQVLSFARGVEGQRISVHISHLAREIQKFVQSTFPKNIRFSAGVPKDTWLVQGDPTQLNQVLLNLCVNARDAMPDGGVLTLATRNIDVDDHFPALPGTVPPGRYVLLEISDTGCGIPADVKDRIFEPFFTTKDPGKGTGLGLSTVLTIVRSHGGSISVESEPGQGSVFKVFLPAQTDAAPVGPLEPMAKPTPKGNGQLVLLVDDDPSVLALTRKTLELFDYQVLSANDGAEAIGLYAMHQEKIGLVLTDMMMPAMDGPALVTALRRINSGVKVIATSGIHGNEAWAATAGLRRFLAKPYTSEALLNAIHQVLTDAGTRVPF